MIVPYLARAGVALARSIGEPRVGPLAETRLPMRVWPSDVDPYLHVNNGRYLTLMDIGRWYTVRRNGLLPIMIARSWWPVVGAAEITFRRELRLGERFELTTRILRWDGKWFTFEHRFERGGDMHARATVRGVFRHRGKSLPFREILAALGTEAGDTGPDDASARGRPDEASVR